MTSSHEPRSPRSCWPPACCARSLSTLAPRAGAAVQAVQKDPEGVVSLSSSATVAGAQRLDRGAVLAPRKEGTDAAAVQAALKEALGAALAQARQVAKPDGHVEVQGGGFSLQPRFNAKGVVNGWTGTTSLIVQGRDMGDDRRARRAASQTMTVAQPRLQRVARGAREGRGRRRRAGDRALPRQGGRLREGVRLRAASRCARPTSTSTTASRRRGRCPR